MRKVLAIILASLFFGGLVMPVCAANNMDDRPDWAVEAENFILDSIYFNSEYNLSNTSSIALGSEIPTYIVDELDPSTVVRSEVKYYPVLSDKHLIGILGMYSRERQYLFSYTEGYTNSILTTLEESDRCAFIWDNKTLEIIVPNHATGAAYNTEENALIFADPYSARIELTQIQGRQARVYYPSGYSLSVPFKRQQEAWSCWAACVACIGQYHRPALDYSSTDVARLMNHYAGGNLQMVQDALSSIYGYTTVAAIGYPSYAQICNIIYNERCPIITGLYYGDNQSGHMVVTYGYAAGTRYSSLMLMDPLLDDFVTVSAVTMTPTSPTTVALHGVTYEIVLGCY